MKLKYSLSKIGKPRDEKTRKKLSISTKIRFRRDGHPLEGKSYYFVNNGKINKRIELMILHFIFVDNHCSCLLA